jgi:hypothetical protein
MPNDADADAGDDPLIASRPPKGLRLGTRLAKVIARLDGTRVRYHLPMAVGGRVLAGGGRLQVERVNDTIGCRMLGDLFLPSSFEFCFHSFWLTRRGMIVLALGTAAMADAGASPPAGSLIQPVDWHGDSVAAAKEWVEKARKDREQRRAGKVPPFKEVS